jgi:hypothetical protein
MNTLQASNSQATIALRAKTADFFKMNLSRSVSMNVARDRNPLRRSLATPRGMEVWETNENMCFALWELMSRS